MFSRAAAYLIAALAVAVLSLAGTTWWLYGEVESTRIDLQRERDQTKLLASGTEKCRQANSDWQSTLDVVQGALMQCVSQRDNALADGARAVAAAQQAAERAETGAAEWRQKFAQARTAPDCRAALEVQLCAAVSDY